MRLKKFLFENQTVKQTIAKNTFWLFFGQMTNRALKAVFVIYAARVLGAESYGVFSFALSFISLVMIFGDIGISPILIREIPKAKDDAEKNKYYSTSFYLKIFLLAFCTILVIIGTFILPNKESATLLWALWFMLVFAFFKDFFLSLARALEKMELDALISFLEVGATVTTGFILLHISATPINLALSYSTGALVGLIVSAFIFRRRIAPMFKNFHWPLVKKILAWTWPFAVGAIISSILTETDTMMLGWLKPIQVVGLYSVALKIPLLLIVPAGILGTAVLPTLSRFSESREKFNLVSRQATDLLLMIGLPILAGGIILAGPIINWLFGSQYLPAVNSFRILLFLIPINAIWVIVSMALFAKNFQTRTMIYSAIAAALNVAINALLIPGYGPAGAAFATILSQAVVVALGWRLFQKVNGVHPFNRNEVMKMTAATIGMTLFLIIPPISNLALWLNIPLAGLLYFALIHLLKTRALKETLALWKSLRAA